MSNSNPHEQEADAIVTALYRRFKEWSQKGFGPDDVTWCEVKADVMKLLAFRAAQPGEEISYAERLDYEERILAVEMELVRAKRALEPLASKADKWEANHAYHGGDSTQIQHRLGDFRVARSAKQRLDRILDGKVERPFAHCCAEGGGRVEHCDCVNKNHGTAWFDAPPALAKPRPDREVVAPWAWAHNLRSALKAVDTVLCELSDHRPKREPQLFVDGLKKIEGLVESALASRPPAEPVQEMLEGDNG